MGGEERRGGGEKGGERQISVVRCLVSVETDGVEKNQLSLPC